MPRWALAAIVCVTLAAVITDAGEVAAQVPVTVLHSFDGESSPRYPYAPLVQGTDGNFYGTTSMGGNGWSGTIFRMTPAGVVTTLHQLDPKTEGATPFGPLVQATDGNFYGSVFDGPSGNTPGRVFKMTPDGRLTFIASFYGTNLLQGPDGSFYGTTTQLFSSDGDVFRCQATCTTLHSFADASTRDGYGPESLILGADGRLYGTTFGGGSASHGTIFRVSTSGAFETLHSFSGGAGGGAPVGGIVQGPDGSIFGTTRDGGSGGAGTVFRLQSDLTFSVVHDFPASPAYVTTPRGLIRGTDGAFYGATNDMLYRIGATGDFAVVSTDPSVFGRHFLPGELMQAADGYIYMTLPWGGAAGGGQIVKISRSDGLATSVYGFPGGPDGNQAKAPVIQAPDGPFYGTTVGGGSANAGTVFVVSSSGQFTTLHAFSGPDGATPSGALIRMPDGRFYGMTTYGGSSDRGTVYRMEPTGEVTVLHSFAGGDDGAYPVGALLLAADGNLYGTTSNGGASDRGTAFRMTPAGSLTILHVFTGISDGNFPASGLFQGTDGAFYGVTLSSGASLSSPEANYGTAYRMTPSGSVTVLHRLYRFDGDYSYLGVNPIMQASDGNIYGTTQGRKSTRGTFFRIDPAGNVTILREFRPDYESPSSGLIQATDGNLYGIIGGAIARLTLAGELTTIRALDYATEGTYPNDLLQAADGNFYTTTWTNGPLRSGTVLRITVVPSPPSVTVATRREGTIRLTWPQGAPGTSYRVKRSGTSGSEVLLASGITTNTFTDSTAVRGRRYYYVVTALNAFGESVASYEVSMTAGQAVAGDFDGDGAADMTVRRRSNSTSYTLLSAAAWTTASDTQLGTQDDIPVAGDFDGDGKADVAVFRPASGMWDVIQSGDGTAFSTPWGNAGDVPVPADYDGDGITDLAVYRPSAGTWTLRLSGSPSTPVTIALGRGTDVPVPGDYDGDGRADPAAYRPSTGRWIVRLSGGGYTRSTTMMWGLAGDIPAPADYDGDGRTDVAVYRPPIGGWFVQSSGTNSPLPFRQWGLPGDIPAAADYDGDGQADMAVFRPSTGEWFVLQSSSGATTSTTIAWGLSGDTPLPNAVVTNAITAVAAAAPRSPVVTAIRASDFGGDNRSDITVFRPGSGEWFVLGSETSYSTARVHQWGLPGDLPAPGDFDGDGVADPAIYRPSTGTWWVLKSSSDFTQSFSIQWGLTGDAPVPADYDGDGRTDIAVYRPSTGQWYIRWSSTDYATASTYRWGLPGDVPVPGDYDGDGLADLAVYRPSNGVWFVLSSSSGYAAMTASQWGLPGDVAVPGDYDGDGRTDLAIYRPSSGDWYVLQSSTHYTTYAIRQWGLPGDTPVPADYDGDGITDFAVFRPGEAVWYVMNSVTGAWDSHQWGLAGDVPVNRR